jgi:hypothetical protein
MSDGTASSDPTACISSPEAGESTTSSSSNNNDDSDAEYKSQLSSTLLNGASADDRILAFKHKAPLACRRAPEQSACSVQSESLAQWRCGKQCVQEIDALHSAGARAHSRRARSRRRLLSEPARLEQGQRARDRAREDRVPVGRVERRHHAAVRARGRGGRGHVAAVGQVGQRRAPGDRHQLGCRCTALGRDAPEAAARDARPPGPRLARSRGTATCCRAARATRRSSTTTCASRSTSQSTYAGHTQEVCGLAWSHDGATLASGGNDNLLLLWDARTGATSPAHRLTQHQAAVKALAWCPWQANLLVSGAGTADRHLRFWNTATGACVNSIDTGSQVCAVQWSQPPARAHLVARLLAEPAHRLVVSVARQGRPSSTATRTASSTWRSRPTARLSARSAPTRRFASGRSGRPRQPPAKKRAASDGRRWRQPHAGQHEHPMNGG